MASEPDNDTARMTFTEHLAELRVRIIRAGYALIAALVVCYIFSNQIFTFLVSPFLPQIQSGVIVNDGVIPGLDEKGNPVATPPVEATGGTEPGGAAPKPADASVDRPKVVALSPFEPVLVAMKIATMGGIVLAMPFILYQACAFVFPGLTKRERNAVLILLLGGGALAVAGVAMAYYAVLPFMLPVLKGWVPSFVETQFQMSTTLDQLTYLFLGFAVTFQMPMFLLILVYLEVITPQTLVAQWRMAVVLIAIVSAVFTPPDAISMTLMMVPLVLLYLGSAAGAYVIVWSKKKRASNAGEAARSAG